MNRSGGYIPAKTRRLTPAVRGAIPGRARAHRQRLLAVA